MVHSAPPGSSSNFLEKNQKKVRKPPTARHLDRSSGRRAGASEEGWWRPGGHSFGGQALALTDEAFHVERALLVGAQSTPMPHWTWRDRARFMPVLYGVAPVVSHVAGYTPGWLGLSEDLPTGVMQEWTRWLRSPGYLFDHVAGASERAAALPLTLEAWAIADDDYAPPPAVRDLVRRFDSAQRQLRDIRPSEVGVRRIGHFGAFRRRFAETLWPQAASALLDC